MNLFFHKQKVPIFCVFLINIVCQGQPDRLSFSLEPKDRKNFQFLNPLLFFISVKGRPPPYTDGEVTTTSGVVYQANPAPTVIPVLVAQTMSPKPAAMTCPSCNQEIVTRVEYKSTTKTHLFAVLLCIVWVFFIGYHGDLTDDKTEAGLAKAAA